MEFYEWEIKYLIDKRDLCKKNLDKLNDNLKPTNAYQYFKKKRELKALETILDIVMEEANHLRHRLGD